MYQYAATCAFLAVILYGLSWLFSRTDIPKIENLPELPGVPIFGSLFLLGKHHARNCAKLAKTYGDVFQVRLGNRVHY
jgi:phenylacetate 2-hydroxylase